MEFFEYKNGELHAEDVPLTKIAHEIGTPCYVYSRAAIEKQWHSLDKAFGNYPHTICYAIKANSNIAILDVLNKLGSGFDIVSKGELYRILQAGGDPSKTVYSGVAKSKDEIEYALKNNIQSINVESIAELERIQEIAKQLNAIAPIAIRVNPDVDPKTHPYISTGLKEAKFGINMEEAFLAYQQAAALPNIQIHGIACHIGSQITSTEPFTDSLTLVLDLVEKLQSINIHIKQLDLGGGLGIDYEGEILPSADLYINSMLNLIRSRNLNIPVTIEPGRFIVGNAGILLSKVEYLKDNGYKNFAVIDAGMNDLLRPSLYQAYHSIINVSEPTNASSIKHYDIVGPICETADVLGHDRSITLQSDDLISIMSAGAYGYVMASNYNSRVKPAEVMVDGNNFYVVKKAEKLSNLIEGESKLPDSD